MLFTVYLDITSGQPFVAQDPYLILKVSIGAKWYRRTAQLGKGIYLLRHLSRDRHSWPRFIFCRCRNFWEVSGIISHHRINSHLTPATFLFGGSPRIKKRQDSETKQKISNGFYRRSSGESVYREIEFRENPPKIKMKLFTNIGSID